MFKLSVLAATAVATAHAGKYHQFNEIVEPEGFVYEPQIVTPVPEFGDDTPTSFDIRNVDGVNYASPNLNQHIPVYCGSCWAHGTTSALADRLALLRGPGAPPQYPAAQYLLNCGMAGSCGGGSAGAVYSFIARKGIPTSSCLQYEAVDNECDAVNTCRNCSPGGLFTPGNCTAVDNYPMITISEHGTAVGAENIMAEIAARGPVACAIDAGPLEEYTGGILTTKFSILTDHIISIAGYGTDDQGTPEADDDVDYWIIRNSWGEYWGNPENGTADPMGLDGFGWARLNRESYKPTSCSWAVPNV